MYAPITGPQSIYQNLPIEPQFYAPSLFFISNISLGQTTTVTTTVDANYVIGQLCRLIIPPTFGCRQLNEATGLVIDIPMTNQVVLQIDSSQNVDPFVSSLATTQPQILPIGDVNSGAINANGRQPTSTFIPGSFIDISPN
jgi:hypothetical protein